MPNTESRSEQPQGERKLSVVEQAKPVSDLVRAFKSHLAADPAYQREAAETTLVTTCPTWIRVIRGDGSYYTINTGQKSPSYDLSDEGMEYKRELKEGKRWALFPPLPDNHFVWGNLRNKDRNVFKLELKAKSGKKTEIILEGAIDSFALRLGGDFQADDYDFVNSKFVYDYLDGRLEGRNRIKDLEYPAARATHREHDGTGETAEYKDTQTAIDKIRAFLQEFTAEPQSDQPQAQSGFEQ
ncbi:MAG TPA: hypothetical protein VLF68_02450 [Candidatus Saccharimonadales bacterium]|nr:hypothetical protein [Candidatus Saccharimonadales bacterium]